MFDARSMPLITPAITTKTVMLINTLCQISNWDGELKKN